MAGLISSQVEKRRTCTAHLEMHLPATAISLLLWSMGSRPIRNREMAFDGLLGFSDRLIDPAKPQIREVPGGRYEVVQQFMPRICKSPMSDLRFLRLAARCLRARLIAYIFRSLDRVVVSHEREI
jgi:hypothetical protein